MTFKPMALTLLLFVCQGRSLAQISMPRANARPPGAPLTGNVVTIDASRNVAAPEEGFLHLGGKSATGHYLEIDSRYLMIDGKPMLPIMGEFHFSRYPAQFWEEEILKMKAGGISVISTYIFWIHHEEVDGSYDWSGDRDLRGFVQLCAKHGMYVYLRPGPWDHGEARNGGLPDWIAHQPGIRSNDPAYLAHVSRLDRQIGDQVRGLLWKDGGPIIGLQLENEYGLHGPEMGSEHILKLKELAIAAGLEVPIYSVTGWPSLDFPPHEVIPVSGGYPDGFWFGSLANLPPSMNYLFNLNRRLGDMGATVRSEDPTGKVDLKHDPYFAAEEAGGMASSYHRRPLLDADDIAALTLTGLGSGLNLYGYYMFQGGQNPRGKLTTLQESQATGYPNDLPDYGYDFQAPLGEYGQERESYRKTRVLHLFVNAFGPELAGMPAVGPEVVPDNAEDTSVPRVALRSRDGSGFLFVNNYVRQTPMPRRPGFQVKIAFADSKITVPAVPVTVPANTYFCWPVNLDMDGIHLRYSTAQLLTKIATTRGATYVFFAIEGVQPTFSIARDSVRLVRSSGASIRRGRFSIDISGLQPGPDGIVEMTRRDGTPMRILLLTATEAQSASVIEVHGAEHLLLSPGSVYLDGATLHIRSTELQKLQFRIMPPTHGGAVKNGAMTVADTPNWSQFRFHRSPASIAWEWTETAHAKPVPPVAMGPYVSWRGGAVATVPSESAFDAAAEWHLAIDGLLPAGVSDLWLNLDYTGDVGRLYVGQRLMDDDFFDGRIWQIGMKRYLPRLGSSGVDIKVLPLRKDAPIYLDPRVRPVFGSRSQLARIKATLAPEYEVTLELK